MSKKLKISNLSKEEFDVIVIGSGMSGLTAAGALANIDKKVLIIEQHYVAGGMTHTFKRKNYIWDVGVHALGEMEKKRMPGKLLNWLSDQSIEMIKYGDGDFFDYDVFHFPDESFSLPGDSRELTKRLIQRFPQEEKSIKQYFELILKVSKLGKGYFFIKVWPTWLQNIFGPLVLKQFFKWSNRTVKDVHDELFNDPKLKAILAGQWGYHGLSPSKASFYIHALVFKHFWNGAYYPKGNSSVIAKKIIEKIHHKNGNILLRTKVKRVLVSNGNTIGIETECGQQLKSPIVIGSGSALHNLNKFIIPNVKNQNYAEKINKLKPTPCHICLYLGFKGDIKKTEATVANQWLYQSWDHENMIWDLEDKKSIPQCLYISFPSLKDPKENEEFHTGEVVTFVKWDIFEKWQSTKIRNRGEEYNLLKKRIETTILKMLAQRFPKLMQHLDFIEVSSPLSTVFYCSVPKGAIYGLEATPKRFQIRELRPQTPIKGFYMSGSDVASCGVVGAMMGGFLTAASIDRKVINSLKNSTNN